MMVQGSHARTAKAQEGQLPTGRTTMHERYVDFADAKWFGVGSQVVSRVVTAEALMHYWLGS